MLLGRIREPLIDVMISAASEFNWGPEAQGVATNFNAVTTTWPAANRAVYIPIVIPWRGTIGKLWWINGSAVAGDVDVGLLSEGGALLTSVASNNGGSPVAQAGTNTIQTFDITDYAVEAGRYYLALACTSASAVLRGCHVLGSTTFNVALGLRQQASACPIPSTATMADAASTFTPHCGLAMRGVA